MYIPLCFCENSRSYKTSESARIAIAELNGKFIGKKPIVVMLHIRKEQRKQLKKLIPDSLIGDGLIQQFPNGSPSSASIFYSQTAQNAVVPLPPNFGKKHISAYYSRQAPVQDNEQDLMDRSVHDPCNSDNGLMSEDKKKEEILRLDANSLLLQQWEQQKKHQHDHHLRHQQQLTKQQTLLQQKHQQQMQRLQRKHIQMQQQYGPRDSPGVPLEFDEFGRRISYPVRMTLITTVYIFPDLKNIHNI
jgi:hypothetical protein